MTMVRAWIFGLLMGAGILGGASPVYSQSGGNSADASYDEGLKAFKAGDFATACEKLSESYRIEASPGVLYAIAECEAKRGRIATALVHYRNYLRASESFSVEQQKKHQTRIAWALEQTKNLGKEVPSVKLILPSPLPQTARVLQDGVELAAGAPEGLLHVDPGMHVFVLKISGGADLVRTVSLRLGESLLIHFELESDPSSPSSAAKAVPVRSPDQPADQTQGVKPIVPAKISDTQQPLVSKPLPPTPSKEHPSHSQYTVPLAVGAAGLGALSVGAIFGGLVFRNASIVHANCGADLGCNQQGFEAAEEAQVFGKVSEVALSAGAVLLAASVVTFFASRAGHPSSNNGRRSAVSTFRLARGIDVRF